MVEAAIPITDSAVAEIAARASTLTERLEVGFAPLSVIHDDARVQARIERWRSLVAEGDPERFDKRLAWDGLDIDRVRRVLGAVNLTGAGWPLPGWAQTFTAAIIAAKEIADVPASDEEREQECDRCLNPEHPLPFEDILLSFVIVARRTLAARIGAAGACLSPAACAALERSLLQELSRISGQAFEVEFSAHRAVARSSLARLIARARGEVTRDEYQAFVVAMLNGGIVSFFREYPVLARLAATVTDFWVDAMCEFLLRLQADLPAIRHAFQPDGEPGVVAAVGASLSDRHSNGRSAIAVTFTSGLKVMYKPKDLSLEVAYFDLLAWLNEHGAPLPFKLLRVLDRAGYGWVEFVEHQPCADEEEARRYYRRAGTLICLIYSLAGNDCHCENLIASGEHPVIVDLETIMHPQAKPLEEVTVDIEAIVLAVQQLIDSVLTTGLLPRWMIGPDGRSVDLSALGGVSEQEGIIAVPIWEHVNTDEMALRQLHPPFRPRANVALLNGVTLSPNDYTAEIVDGFQQMYHLLMREREALLAAGGPQATLAGRQVRFIVRPTVTYAKLLAGALHPQHLRDGADRSIELDILGRPLLDTEARNPYWPLHRVEQRDLEQMDVPYFSVRADSDSLLLPGGEAIEQCFIETCANLAAARLRALDTEDLGRQLAFIRASLYTRTANEQGTTWPDHEPGMGVEADAPVSRDELLRLAARIAEELDTKAIRSNDGSVSWIGVSYIPQAERYQLQPLGPELYAGTVGVALFLAAFEQVSGGAGVRDLALGALQPLRRDLREHADRLVRVIGIGGAAGCGSLIYGLLQIGRLLGEADLVGDARRAAAALTEERIAQDRTLDLIGGAAGAILGLLTLYDVTGDATLLERAAVCGRHLLEQRADLAGQRAWKTLGGEALTGFSHGASGIGYALVRLYQRTGETGLLEATAEGFAYERSLFSSEEGNWRDLRGFKAQGRDGFQVSWCHGAPGIGLARLGALPVLDDEAIRQDLESALQTTEAFGARGVDQLCCGALGRAEILLQASQRLSRPELRDAALRQAAHVVRRAERDGHYRLQADLPEGVFSPSFFQGTAGIGYELLRLAYPDRLPSPLLWE